MKASQLSPENHLQLYPGKRLDVELTHPLKVRIKTTLVGYELGKYVILKYPKIARANDYKDVLREGNIAIVRYLLEGNEGKCFAFRSSIKHISQFPEKFIFIEYPEHLENRELRLEKRQVTHIPANLMLTGNGAESTGKISGVISDISPNGCGFSFKTSSEKVNVNKRDIFVGITSPVSGEVKIPAKVCNSRNESGKVNVGIQFVDAEQLVIDLMADLQIEVEL